MKKGFSQNNQMVKFAIFILFCIPCSTSIIFYDLFQINSYNIMELDHDRRCFNKKSFD